MTLEDVPISMTISQVKERLSEEKHLENDTTIRFIFGGKNLDDAKTVMDYNIQNVSCFPSTIPIPLLLLWVGCQIIELVPPREDQPALTFTAAKHCRYRVACARWALQD